MIFLPSAVYVKVSNWFLTNVSSNEALLAVFIMWLNTEVTYATIVAFFYAVEKSAKFNMYKIHSQPSNERMMRDAILFKPVAWMVDIPIYFLSFQMMGWRGRLFVLYKNFWSNDSSTKNNFSTMSTTMSSSGPPSPLDPLPDSLTFLKHVLILTATYDLLFYLWHRALHTKSLWKYHKKHHEVKVSFTCANDHESVLEVAGNIFWKMIPPVLIGCHVYTVCVYRAVVKFFALLHHSGFELPIFQPLQCIPGIASPSYHDFHHFYGHGNYGGVLTVWDRIFGTHKEVKPMKSS